MNASQDDLADFIVVGAGSAGCLLAARLSENPAQRVVLLEAGGTDWNPMLHVPMASGKLLRRGIHGWKFWTDTNPGLAGRALFWPRGKVLGGCSAINGMVYMRGQAADYDRWAAEGAAGWSFPEVLPYFLRSESHLDRRDDWHGRAGELPVARGRMENPLFDAFIAAGEEAGFLRTDDFNGAQQEGFGRFDFTIARGRRVSTASAFLRAARPRANLTLLRRAQVQRVILQDGLATGVEYRQHGRLHQIRARRGVVLCAGVVGSPHLLMLSGIGPGAALSQAGIRPLIDLPGVGVNLQDHLGVMLAFASQGVATMHQITRADRAALGMFRALLLRSGPFTHFPMQGGAFTRTTPLLPYPDVQWHFMTGLGVTRLRLPLAWRRKGPLDRDGFSINVCVLRPYSRGRITLRSADPLDAPRIEPGYLSDARDLATLRRAVRQARDVAASPALARYVQAEILPGVAIRDDAGIDDWIRRNAGTVHHQVGTCRMGQDALSVVDPRLRVHGVQGLYVADASVMPSLIGGNTQAPTLMIAERCAAFVQAKVG